MLYHKTLYLKAKLSQFKGMSRWLSTIAISAIAFSLASCTPNAPLTNSNSSQTPTKRLQIVTTFVPITDFTKGVAGNRADVTQLLPTNVGPHDFQAKPEDAQKLTKADVLIENGLGMETFLDELVKNAGNSNLKIIDSSKGVQTISTDAISTNAITGKQQTQSKQVAFNPHIWLDPKRAIQQVANIRDGLIAADPDGKDIYIINAAAYTVKLQKLDSEFTQKLQPYAGKTFVTYHDFATYFAQSYNLKAQFLVGIPEENASPVDVTRVINSVKDSKLKTLLIEPQAVGDAFSSLAKDLNVQVGSFDPMETAIATGVLPDYYFTVMRQNLTNLEAAFGAKSIQSFLPSKSQSGFLIMIGNRLAYDLRRLT